MLPFHKNQANLYYFIEFINESRRALLGALKIIYFLSIGLTLTQITMLYAIGQAALLLFEFPTGAFADAFGRRKSILLSFFLFSISFLSIFFTENYYYLIFFNALAIISWTFQSGTTDAWIIDTLGLGQQENNLEKEHSRTHLFSSHFIIGKIGWVVGGALGSVVAYFYLKSIWIALAVLHLLCFGILYFTLKEENFIPTKFNLKSMLQSMITQSKQALQYSWKNKILLVLLLLILLKGIPFSVFEVAWPVLFKEILKIPAHYFGAIVAISTLFAVAGAYLAKKISRVKGVPFTLFLFYLFFVFSAFGLGVTAMTFAAIGAFCFFQVGEGGTRPLAQSALHRFIPTPQRASILSLRSMLSGAGSMIGYVVAGSLMLWTGPQYALYATAVIIMLLGSIHVFTLWKADR